MNKLTERLISEGYSRENPPTGYLKWSNFYGGWTYSISQQEKMWVKTPCGVYANAVRTIDMSYMGIDWCLENDNVTIVCPYRKKNCLLNDPLLRDKVLSNIQIHCAAKITNEEPPEEKTTDYLDTLYQKKEEDKIESLKKRKKRFCRGQVLHNSATDQYYLGYDPMICANMHCQYCTMFNKELTKKKGNVFYDVKTIKMTEAKGLFPEEKIIVISKGKRLFEKPVNLDICQWIAKHPAVVYNKVKHSREIEYDLFWYHYHDKYFEYEVQNIRAEQRESRDLLQDLEDIRCGITVTHESDQIKAKKEEKRERTQKAKEQRAKKILKDIARNGKGSVDKYRLEGMLRKGLVTESEILEAEKRFTERTEIVDIPLF